MVNVIIHGCNGRMGHVLNEIIETDPGIKIVAGVDAYGKSDFGFNVYRKIGDCREAADVVIDFSNANAVKELMDFCSIKALPCVLCTTGLSDTELEYVHKAAEKTAILKSANMSVGINVLLKVLRDAAPVLTAAGFDMEIVEKHHNQKVDAPSGTALALADDINEAAGGGYEYIYDRSSRREKRPQKEIGISSVRGGSIVGDHDVIFAGKDEVITFSHTAYSRAIFAKGAVQAAKYLAGKPAGMYDMSNVVG